MFATALTAAISTTLFGPPQPWALNFSPPPRIPLVADVDGDGFDDLISVSPTGDVFIDVSLNCGGQKSGRPVRAIDNWGKDCQAAAAGRFSVGAADSVVGMFEGRELRLASNFKDGKFRDIAHWMELPQRLSHPQLGTLADRTTLIAYSTSDGSAYRIDPMAKTAHPFHVRSGLVWIGGLSDDLYGMRSDGQLLYLSGVHAPNGPLERIDPKSRPAYGRDADDDGSRILLYPSHGEPPCAKFLGNVAGDRRLDAITFRFGSELHTANAVTVSPQIGAHGLSGPPGLDSSGDGLMDDWKIRGYRGLDLKEMGCKPGQTDVLVFVARFSTVDEAHVREQMDRATKFYAGLPVTNRNGTQGWHLHVMFQAPIPPADQNKSWGENRDKYLPERYRGVAHWMQITPGGGGQADELGDGGGCGSNALWQVFVHELGHQLGMDHNGFWGPSLCPTYPSLMNYAYSYSLNDDGNQVSYSTGALSSLVLNETDLDKTLPFPYEKVKFLSKGPYHYRLKPIGNKTLIDWNWDGRFDEHHVRAEINYSYATTAGPRDDPDKTECAPWLFVHRGSAYVLFGQRPIPAGNKDDPTLSATHPGSLMVRRLAAPLKWDSVQVLERDCLIGDPVAIDVQGEIRAFYATPDGMVMNRFRESGRKLTSIERRVLDADRTCVPTVGTSGDRTYLFLWNPATGVVRYRSAVGKGEFGLERTLAERSAIAPGMAVDTDAHQVAVGMAQDQAKKPGRWQVRQYRESDGLLKESSMDWVEGANGNAAGNGRCTLLFDANPKASAHGRLLFYCQGRYSPTSPWCCAYVAEQIADKSVNGGWLVKRFYDEWTQTRSAPAAAWFGGDVLYAYRWVDTAQGDGDNKINLGYHGLGIFPDPMGDHDDLTYMKTFGIPYSIVYLATR